MDTVLGVLIVLYELPTIGLLQKKNPSNIVRLYILVFRFPSKDTVLRVLRLYCTNSLRLVH